MNITEAAQRCGVNPKTIRRAVHTGQLHATWPHKNRAEITESELQRFASGKKMKYAPVVAVASDQSQAQRITELEARVRTLELQVSRLLIQGPKRPMKEKAIGHLPATYVDLMGFAQNHGVSIAEITRALNMHVLPAKQGHWTDRSGKDVVSALDVDGRKIFYEVYHNSIPTFMRCEDCPHV